MATRIGYRNPDNITDEWYTPEHIIEAARTVMGSIDLDPASCEYANRIVKAKKIFTIHDDGLYQQWYGNVWLNPPYSQTIEWTRRLRQEYENDKVTQAVLLVNANPEVKWFRELYDYPFALTHVRTKFYNEMTVQDQPISPSAIFYFGKNIRKFAAEVYSFATTFQRYRFDQ
jgi:ParB family transcriptional regulator, chromosome partitioning protein